MVFGEFNEVIKSAIEFKNSMIECTLYEYHLGNPLFSDNSDKIRDDGVNSLFIRFNSFTYKFKYATSDVKYFLFKSNCLVAYGCQLCNNEGKKQNDSLLHR